MTGSDEGTPRTVTGRSSAPATVHTCRKAACYNQRNSRECWTAVHLDGRRTFEHPSHAAALEACVLPVEDVDERHRMSWC